MGIGESEAKAFWLAFLLNLKERGLEGVKLVISDSHSGLSDTAGVLCQLAALPGPLHAQRAEPRQQGQPVSGTGSIAAGVRADLRERRSCHLAGSCRPTGEEQSGSHGDDGRGRSRRAGLLQLPECTQSEDPLNQHAGAPEQR